jgi:hypothetical protein
VRAPRLAAAARLLLCAALSACADPKVVPMTLSLDRDSCGTDEPGRLLLSCAAAVGVTLRSRTDGSVLEQACEDLPGAERTLAELPAVLSRIDLSGLTEPSIWLELGLFTPRSAADGCPAVGEGRTEMALWAAVTVELAGGEGALVELECSQIGRSSAGCNQACDDGYLVCSNDGGRTACDLAHQSCADSCDDDKSWCLSYCENGRQLCIASGGESACGLVLDGCFFHCDEEYSGDAEDRCEIRCYDDYQSCLQTGFCEQRQAQCRDGCGESGCAALL